MEGDKRAMENSEAVYETPKGAGGIILKDWLQKPASGKYAKRFANSPVENEEERTKKKSEEKTREEVFAFRRSRKTERTPEKRMNEEEGEVDMEDMENVDMNLDMKMMIKMITEAQEQQI